MANRTLRTPLPLLRYRWTFSDGSTRDYSLVGIDQARDRAYWTQQLGFVPQYGHTHALLDAKGCVVNGFTYREYELMVAKVIERAEVL